MIRRLLLTRFFCTDLNDNCLIEKEIAHLTNLCHPCIAAPIGFIFGSESQELKVVGLYSANFLLGEIVKENPGWWTPTAKAKTVAGLVLVLGLRFAHSLGLIPGHLRANIIVFDLNHGIQITDFRSGLLSQGICGFSRERWNPEMDVRGFVSNPFEIVVGHPVKDEMDVPADIPRFVSEMIKAGLSGEWRRLSSFPHLFETLQQHDLEIVSGVDSAEGWAFMDSVSLLEQSR
jgi:hypothetical protein